MYRTEITLLVVGSFSKPCLVGVAHSHLERCLLHIARLALSNTCPLKRNWNFGVVQEQCRHTDIGVSCSPFVSNAHSI